MKDIFSDPRTVTVGASGLGLAAVTVITGILGYFKIDVGSDFAEALMALIIGAAGWFMHSTRLQEDFAALHERVLSQIKDHPPTIPTTEPPSTRLPRT